jgi:hypothetical protein
VNLSEEDNIDMQNILDSILKKGAPDDFRVLLESQLSNSKIGLEKRQRQWDPRVISICLSINCRSRPSTENVHQQYQVLVAQSFCRTVEVF